MNNQKQSPKRTAMDILKKTIAGILAGIVLAVFGYFWGQDTGKSKGVEVGYKEAQSKYIKQVKSAPEVYVEELERIITIAISGESPDIIADARAVVSVRDDLRRSLTSIASSLNSQIDRLSTEVKKAEEQVKLGEAVYTRDIERTIDVIGKKWPSKKAQIEVEVRKLIAELGLEKIPDRPNS